MKQFDDIFRKRVEEVFSAYNADQFADKGWKSFMAARKGRRRLNGVIPLWAKAATVAIVVSTGTFIAYQTLRVRPDAELLTGTGTTGVKEEVVTGIRDSQNNLTVNQMPQETGKSTETGNMQVIEGSDENDMGEQPVSGKQSSKYPEAGYRPEAGNLTPDAKVREIPIANARPFIVVNSFNTITEQGLVKLPERQIIAETEIIEPENYVKKITLMAGLSGLLAGNEEETTGAQGIAMGLYIERRITDRISFRPGIALAMNAVGLYGDNGNGKEMAAYSVPLYDGNSGTLDYYEGRLNMLAMEIPLNFVFKILKRKKSDLYLSAGASTMIYLNQQFEGDFINEYTQTEFNSVTGQYDTNTRQSTVSVSNDYGAFSRTDLLGLANFSAGYSLPYGKTGKLFIEPFLQIPLSDLTSLNLRVRYGGVSMKLRFGDRSE